MKIKSQKMIYFKIGFILILILLLFIPNGMLQSLIWERQGLSKQTKQQVAESWGGAQKIIGPLLSVPYSIEGSYGDGSSYRTTGWYHLLPEALNIDATLNPEIKTLGIYDAIVYEADLKVDGAFNINEFEKIKHSNSVIEYDKAILSASVADMNGISKDIVGSWDKEAFSFDKGTPISKIFHSGGFHYKLNLDGDTNNYPFSFELALKGSENMNFVPYAANTNIQVNSTWPSPSFIGRSPNSEISKDGFQCQWKLNEHNRILPGAFQDDNANLISQKSFGVDLIHGVDHYQKNMRSAKYSTLIIALTFMVFFFFETMYKNKIHAIQYSLVGVALSLFYYLLLSFSEHISFSISYIIAACATIMLISTYSITLIKKKKSVFILTTILVCLYSYIFVLLQLEDFALIAGSIGLFIILAIVMYLSRNMNWYELGVSDKTTETQITI